MVPHDAIHSVALAPRLAYSQRLLGETADTLSRRLGELRDAGSADSRGGSEPAEMERTILFCLEAIIGARRRLQDVSSMAEISATASPLIPVLRTTSARLSVLLPGCSGRLCELAVHLGSIVLDSAILAKTGVDIKKCGSESAHMLDQAKLITNSKLSKLYPDMISPTCSTGC